MTGSGGVQGDSRGGGLWRGRACIERWNKKSPGPAHPCAAPETRAKEKANGGVQTGGRVYLE